METFLAAALRGRGLGAVLALTAGRAFAAFFAARMGLRAAALAAVARFALGLVDDFALTARFAEGFALERDVDRLNPFVRLLLMCGISKGCSPFGEQPRKRRELTIASTLNQRAQSSCGCFKPRSFGPIPDTCANKEKHLKVIVGYVKVRLGLRRPNPPRQTAPTAEVTCFQFKTCNPRNRRFSFYSPGNIPPRPSTKSRTMADTPILLREQQYHRIKAVLARLRMDASAKVVFLVDKDGQEIASQGEVGNLDTTSLASLAAGNVAATGGMAQLIGEKEFPTLSHEGEKESIHISVVGRLLLVVVFDERSSLGLVKLRSKQISHQLAAMFDEIAAEDYDDDSPFAGITDEDIDSLFS